MLTTTEQGQQIMLTKTRQDQQQGVLLERSPPATDSMCLAHQVIGPQPPEYDIVVGDMTLFTKGIERY